MRKLAILYLAFWWLPLISPSFAQEAGKGDVTPLLLPGLGNHRHATSTKNPEAQKYFAALWVQHEFEVSWKNPKISLHLEDL